MAKENDKKHKGMVLVISAPSGTGKDATIEKVLKKSDNIVMSISATTRSPRALEKNGKSYYFLSVFEFKERIKNKEMLEYTKYCGDYYGTLYEPLIENINKGLDVILKIEVDGARQIRNIFKDSVHIFVLPPSLKELSKRLADRGTETQEAINERLGTAIKEMKFAKNYDYAVINKNLDACADEIYKIIQVERLRISRLNYKEEIVREVF
ncbi:MAG: guanylate kinase [Oscillospiraceae bacterium]|jgi:guanylate kinase|nr:guanylate kinase [Oscillospiraceae bacterium]